MLYICCVNKSRTSVRSCGSCFPQHKTLLVFQIIPISFARRISLSEMSLWKFGKRWSSVALALWVPRCMVSAESPSLVPTGLEAPLPFPCPPRPWLWHCTLGKGFSRTSVHANENSEWNPMRIPAAWSQVRCHGPAPLRWDWHPIALRGWTTPRILR